MQFVSGCIQQSGLFPVVRFRAFFRSSALTLGVGLLAALYGLARAAEQAESGRGTVLILGDSLAAGYGVAPDEAFPALLQEKIVAGGLRFKIVNAGVSGDTSAGGLRRLNWLLRRPVDVLVLELGGNDGLRGFAPSLTRSNLQQIIDRTRETHPAARVVIAGMRMPESMGRDFAREYEELFPALAKQNNAALIPFLLEGIGAHPRFNQTDLIHPNSAGHALVASNVWTSLEPILRRLAFAEPAGGVSSKQ